MCGIAGLIGTEKYKEQDVKKMINKIDYRGPDEQGTIDLDNIYLGHARLAVVDPENGTQPMSNHDKTVWVVFNGEIYNYRDFGDYQSDGECLLHLYDQFGTDFVTRLDGEYALTIVDFSRNYLDTVLEENKLSAIVGLTRNTAWKIAVSYTHLTLPTNREV